LLVLFFCFILMIEKIEKILTNKLLLTLIFFVWFILLTLVILNSFYPEQVPFYKNYLYLLHFLVVYLNLYLIIYILKTQDFWFDSRYFFLIALNLLIYTPFYIILKQQKIAEQLSIRAYYAMVAGVIVEILLMILESKFKNNAK